jgi:hypothetical protein
MKITSRKKMSRKIGKDCEFMNTFKFSLLISLGSVLCGVTDLFWVILDMIYMYHFHHIIVTIGLLVANVLMIVSFIYLYRSIISHVGKTIKHKK